jgi:hypothetical protein
MATGAKEVWSQGLLLPLPGLRIGSSTLLESRLNISHSPMDGSGPGAGAFPPGETA